MEETQPESAAIGGGGFCIDRRCGAVRVRLQQRVTVCLYPSQQSSQYFMPWRSPVDT